MSSPPPPYSLRPPPAYIHSQKPPAHPPRQTSRQTLSNALQRARYAVQLDSSGSDVPSAIAAYDEAIELLQHVIARRSRKPGNKEEVDRVVNIHDRYAQRVRDLCRTRRLSLPSHVADARLTSHDPLLDHSPDAVSPKSADSEWDTELSSLLLSASSSSIMSASSIDSAHHCHEWIVSEACDEEVKEWDQYLNGGSG